MNKLNVAVSSFFLVICALIGRPTFAVTPTEVTQSSIKVLQTYHDSGIYLREFNKVAVDALNYIRRAAAKNHQELSPQKLAIILDIDETSLSNYDKMVARKFTGTHEEFHKEVLAANAPAIKPMLSVYKEALRNGVAVFFVTGRRESERAATDKNLKYAGYKQWAGLYLKPEHYDKPSIVPFKAKIRELISNKGYTIIAAIGDQYSDLVGGYAQKTFKLPNPYYYLP